jgi:hypothetical protein
MLAVHYYLIFDGGDDQWRHMKSFYERDSVFRYGNLGLRFSCSNRFPVVQSVSAFTALMSCGHVFLKLGSANYN